MPLLCRRAHEFSWFSELHWPRYRLPSGARRANPEIRHAATNRPIGCGAAPVAYLKNRLTHRCQRGREAFAPQAERSGISAADIGPESENPRSRISTPERPPVIRVLESAEAVVAPIDTSGVLAAPAVEIAEAEIAAEIESSESSTARPTASRAEPQTPEIVGRSNPDTRWPL